jgi:hypothetical protein
MTPTNCAVFGLRTNVLVMLNGVVPVVPPSAEAPAPAAQAPVFAAPRTFTCPSACGSPRLLGDVPLLLSEQFLYGSGGSQTVAEAGRRVRGGSACSDALQSSASAEAEKQSAPLCRSDSFGADSKFGFEEGANVFVMDWDSDSNSDEYD